MRDGIDYDLKVLVAEDFATMRRILCNTLKQIGFNNVLEAEDGLAALKVMEHEPVGLVITDWYMPNMGGLELLERIRSNPATAALPVLMVTMEDLKDHVIAAVQAGVSSYLVKPFTLESLQEKIEAVLRKSRIPPAPKLMKSCR